MQATRYNNKMSTMRMPSFVHPPEPKFLRLENQLANSADAGNKLCQRYEQLLRSEKYFDCVFHFGSRALKCHKLILSAASPVFEAMFYGPLCESKPEIEILDISADGFHSLLGYIYAGRVEFEQLDLEDIIELYYAAEKYLLSELSVDCLSAVKRKLRFVNILPALELSVCMSLTPLIEICLGFFARCCLSDPQYMAFLKHNYVHVSKECIKTIIATNHEFKHLMWYVFEWCQHECKELGLQKGDCKQMIDELQLSAQLLKDDAILVGRKGPGTSAAFSICKSMERSYYKACRPFTVENDAHEWHVTVKCDRFISLMGVIINSRLTPSPIAVPASLRNMPTIAVIKALMPTEYNESLEIEIRAKRKFFGDSEDDADRHDAHIESEESDTSLSFTPVELNPVIWRYSLKKQPTKYNTNLHIQWEDNVILSPDTEYQIKLIWPSEAYGAEYPCSLQSNEVDGVTFKDFDAHCGSPIKGLRFLSLV